MFFPIGDDNIQGGYKPILSYSFLGLNVLIFIYQITKSLEHIGFIHTEYGIIPAEISVGEDLFTLLTSMFLHGDLMHLGGNMLFLWIFADNIEAIIGTAFFGLYYILGGLFAAVVHVYIDPMSTIPTIGASGAISAVMGTYLVMFPKSRIKMIFLLMFRRPFFIPAILFLGIWFGQQLLSGIGTVGATEESGGVAWWAHIGGFVYGVAAGFLFKKLYGSRYSFSAQA